MPRNPNKRTTSKWTTTEDATLRRLVQQYGEKSWALIARELPNRAGKQCRERWRNQLDPTIIRSPFSPQEDAKVIQMVKANGTTWSRIAEALPGRTENMIKNRYYANLIKRMGDKPLTKAQPISSGQKASSQARARRSRGGRPQYDSSESESELSLSESEDEVLPKRKRQFDSEEEPIEERGMEDEEIRSPDVPNTPALSESTAADHHVLATPMGETPQDFECNLKRIDSGKASVREQVSLLRAWLAPEPSSSSGSPSSFLNMPSSSSVKCFDSPGSDVQWQAQLTTDMDRAVTQLQQWRNSQAHPQPFRTIAPTILVLGVDLGAELLCAHTLCEMHHA
eukprot:c13795_g1_i1.p1 GENE.c13795_g1_i1~~c13795_g1_i1.p1  ORF type:complete len:339 (+),score=46.09 c13795_g1_i1:80-1096(+)